MLKVCVDDAYVSTSASLQNSDMNDVPRSERPLKADDDGINAMIKSNPPYTTRDIVEAQHIVHSTVQDNLKELGIASKFEVWISHKLKEILLVKRLSIYHSLFQREENDPFLKHMVTGDGKRIVYNKVAHKFVYTQVVVERMC